MNESEKQIKNSKGIPLVVLIIMIILILLAECIVVVIIKRHTNSDQDDKKSKNSKVSSVKIVDVPNIEQESLPNLNETTWKMSIFVEELIGENITESKKQDAIDEYSQEYGYIVFDKNGTIICNVPNNKVDYEIDDNLITIDMSQEGLEYLDFEGGGILSLVYQNGKLISPTRLTAQYDDITIKSRVKLEKVSSDPIPELAGTDWKISNDLKTENLSEEKKIEFTKKMKLWEENTIHFDDKQYIFGEEKNNYSIMGSVLKLYLFDFQELIYEDGKFVCKIDETGPEGEIVKGTIVLTKVNNGI